METRHERGTSGRRSLWHGLARGAYEYALNYAKERSQFGRPIIKFGAVQEMLVDMAQQARVAELLTCQAASLVDQGKDCLAEIIQARLAATEAARKASLYGVQIFGGYAMPWNTMPALSPGCHGCAQRRGTKQVLSTHWRHSGIIEAGAFMIKTTLFEINFSFCGVISCNHLTNIVIIIT